MLLAIDTSAGSAVSVVDRDRGVLAEASVADTMRHAEVIGSLIRECLDASGVAVSALSGVAVGMGPGPFTGLRVGIAAARAFALGAGKPVIPVVSHDAIAFEKYRDGAHGGLLVVTDARRRELYWSAYVGVDDVGLPLREDGPGLAKPDDVPHAGLARFDAATVSAGALGMLAESLYAHGRPFAGEEPLYLRSPDVTLSTGPKRVNS
ncbi:tRNA (adenosine(37)-N6)-threonylcarbamoyltransferase complex dimerization subunit type 1 TsaB [Microbacterium sp. STN6]|uniref:tRNA (adenosine(37)-N6)-threonylcarbamoyltransferase complex dimerization subunit type 1 TsaB n=1 Tax=Microbacterium sp. STN6 TaxID=2995588 RepID=UPI002260EDCD|nr:tRNA (adenosine(37)-N6)-threonylcarbamoyltransferase complex dimerization subunit type 1 TsaB [Microbacterium sp. STN6]MCX7523253.1 tRNA (adenosine(37)-N6)-threonylcarbamoyltransferase complex dimerization subunit type 1 TsaB [Microbacterium sp. STN6]